MTQLEAKVLEYLKGERQWTRQCRIDRARLMLETCDSTGKPFWNLVLSTLGASHVLPTAPTPH